MEKRKRWKRIIAGAALAALLSLAAACSEQRQIPAAAPTATVDAGSTAGGTDTAPSSTTDSRLSQPESEPAPTDSASPAASPSVSPTPSPSPPTAGDGTSASSKPDVSKPGKPASPSPSPSAASKEITISVVGNAEWGSIVHAESVALKNNDTAADLLIRTLKAHKLAFEKRGSGALFYVVGIDGLYEFDDGPTSGWKFRVNGEVKGVGAGSVELKPGDKVEWFYTSEDADAEEQTDGKGTTP